jgi:hypothetical protein
VITADAQVNKRRTLWVTIPSGTSNNLRTVSFGDGSMVYAGGRDGIIIRSTNNGLNWSTVTTGVIGEFIRKRD